MPRSEPHPLALFSLKPLNPRAEAVLARNDHLASRLRRGELVLDVGHAPSRTGDKATLATLGRNGDIELEGSSIAKTQCSFEIDLETKVVMFYDRSHSQTSKVFGQGAIPFEYGRPRKVVVQENVNTMIGMGGVGRDLFLFKLVWHHSPAKAMDILKERESTTLGYEEHPRLAQTVEETDTVMPPQRETRLHRAGLQQPKLRYTKIKDLGSGNFGAVYKAVDVDSGKLLAVKRLTRPPGATEQEWRTLLQKGIRGEIDILSSISHAHIVDYITSQGWNEGEGEVEIVMGLKEGTLQLLVSDGCYIPVENLASIVLNHMLQAIDFLATRGIVHRDIKPENILYVSQQGEYNFQLGDFGLSNHQINATTFAGSIPYMAPEIFQGGEQTHKADVWSLYVTMLWTMDVEGFRGKSFPIPDATRAAVLSSTLILGIIREMARPEPHERASAAQMLVKCYNGQGLTTPRNWIPPLIEPVEADSRAPAHPVSRPEKQRGLPRDPPPAARRFGVEKSRSPQAQPR